MIKESYRKILVLYPKPKVEDYSWRQEWFSPYISFWSLMERFKYVNGLTSQDILNLFVQNKSQKKYSRDLYQLTWIDFERIPASWGQSLQQSQKEIGEIFPFSFANWNRVRINALQHFCFSKIHRFCPECMKIGFHSWLHQMNFFEACPFHEVLLQDRCPACQNQIIYEVNLSYFKFGFRCKCGYYYYCPSESGFRIDWPLSNHLNFHNKNKSVKDFFDILINKNHDLEGISTYPEIFTHPSSHIVFSLQLALRNDYHAFYRIHKMNPILTPGKWLVRLYTKILVDQSFFDLDITPKSLSSVEINQMVSKMSFWDYASLCLYQVFRSVLRHLRKKVLHSHRRCISDYVRMRVPVNQLCPYAIAYVRLRQEIENLDKLTMVENGDYFILKRRWRDVIPNITLFGYLIKGICDNDYFKKLMLDTKTIENDQKLWPVGLWIYQHVFAMFILQRFYDWVYFVNNNSKGHSVFLAVTRAPEIKYPLTILSAKKDKLKIIQTIKKVSLDNEHKY